MDTIAADINQTIRDTLTAAVEQLSRRTFSPRIKLLTIAQVSEATSLAKSTIWAMIADGRFPKPLEGFGKALWRESTLVAWLDRNDPNRRSVTSRARSEPLKGPP